MSEFLTLPGSSGATGALLDEYARAANEFCEVVESFDQQRFDQVRESEDPDTASVVEICRHACDAAFGYANYLRRAFDHAPAWPRQRPGERIHTPGEVRKTLAEAVRFTETAAEPLRTMEGDEVLAATVEVSWGPSLNPESILEHAICHLLRHRRQLERW